MTRMLESGEAARRLGVKRSTLYAYVSRGRVRSHPAPDGRSSLFDAEDIERLARQARGGRTSDTRLVTVTTGVTQLGSEGPSYRGRLATTLASTASFEQVAELLWGGTPELVDAGAVPEWAGRALRPPAELSMADRLRWAVIMGGAGDPLRADARPQAVQEAARRLVATLVAVLEAPPEGRRNRSAPLVLGEQSVPASIASALAMRLAARPTKRLVRAVNGALVLLADHELATSTLAVRVAASTRADLYEAVLAGLGTLSGPLHGDASPLAHRLLRDATERGAPAALNDALRWHGTLPGFGHVLYRDGDPRFAPLYALFERVAEDELRRSIDTMIDLAQAHGMAEPNVDLALAALTVAGGMPAEAGATIFALARLAGWTAHYLEELDEQPLRFRPRAIYLSLGNGPPPAER